MDVFLGEWVNLLLRWFHMIVGIGWIGTSFYFMALDYGLDTKERKSEGVYGTPWQVHGGGFYHVEKFTVAPPHLPPHLHWFKWDAYLTWVSGFGLMIVQYYLHAKSYLIDPAVMPLETWEAIAISVASLIGGWAIYEALCRSPLGKNTTVLSVLCVRADPRGLGALHQGVFRARRVSPCRRLRRHHHGVQRVHDHHPEPAQDGGAVAGRAGARRALRADRQAALDPQQLSDLAGAGDDGIAALSVPLGASAVVDGGRADHHRGRADPPLHEPRRCRRRLARFDWAIPIALFALICAIWLTAPRAPAATGSVSDTEVLALTVKHCTMCHARKPTHESFKEAPKNVMLESTADIRKYAPLILTQTVQNKAMPLGNQTAMTDGERQQLGQWIAAQH